MIIEKKYLYEQLKRRKSQETINAPYGMGVIFFCSRKTLLEMQK